MTSIEEARSRISKIQEMLLAVQFLSAREGEISVQYVRTDGPFFRIVVDVSYDE